MLKNLFFVALRNLMKRKVYAAINVMGLAISIAACLLIVLYLSHETSYDSFFPDKERTYKLVLERKYPNHSTYFSVVPHSYAAAMQRDFPEVESTLQLLGPNRGLLVTYQPEGDKEKRLFEEDYFFASDSNFLSFFKLPLIKGNPATALHQLNEILVSASTAKKYFGDGEPLGKTITVAGFQGELKVVGVFNDFPENSHIRADFVSSFDGAAFRQAENFIAFDSHTYIKLQTGTTMAGVVEKLPAMVNTYAKGQIERELKQSWDDYQKAGNGYRYFLQPLPSIHLDPTNLEFTITPSGNLKYVYGLAIIAALILIIACINFMNLSTARSAERAREVGLRKVLGSQRNQLIAQFLVEAVILTTVATLIAVLVASLMMSSFNLLIGKHLIVQFTTPIVLGLTGFALFVGVLAGLYPAFVLSSFQPVEVMKGRFTGQKQGRWLRNGLVIFQFMISIFLIVGATVVNSQMAYMREKDLGFEKEHMLMVERAQALGPQWETFVEEIRRMPQVVSASGTSARLGNRDDVFGQMFQPQGSTEVLTVKTMLADDYFTADAGLELADGRFFSKESSDSLNILLNETAVRTIGLDNPVGRKLSNTDLFRGDPKNEKERFFTVIGVIKDFHFQSLRDEITPLVVYNGEIFGRRFVMPYVAVRLKPGEYQQTLSEIESKWHTMVPDRPFRYEFLEDNLETGYADERRSAKVFEVFSALAILIACVGLFGLSAYTTGLRIREIGIRKVLGASVSSVVILLSRDFTILVVIAFGLASPLAWLMMSKWLEGFAYRVELGIGAFALAGLLSLAIAWITISFQSIKAAVSNPVNSLKAD